MNNKVYIFLLLTFLIETSIESPVNSRFKNREKRENNYINYEELNTNENFRTRDYYTRDYENTNDDFRTRDYENTNDDFRTRDYYTRDYENTNEDNIEASTIDLKHPCGPLIVNLDRDNYYQNSKNQTTLLCNAYFSRHTQSRCNDGTVVYAQFNLKINGKLVIEEFMKRLSMSYEGLSSKFIVNEIFLRQLSYNNHPKAVCEASIMTSTGSAINQSYESIINMNKDNFLYNTEAPEEATDGNNIHLNTNNDFITRSTINTINTTHTNNSCNNLNVNIYNIYNYSRNATILCSANFTHQCYHRSTLGAKFELIIDGFELKEKYITTFSVWNPNLYTEFFVNQSTIEYLYKTYDKSKAYCRVVVVSEYGNNSNKSSSIDLKQPKETLVGSPLNGSCVYPRECKSDRNLTCDWDSKCKCKYDDYRRAYYVPYKHSNEWYCARPAKHNEQCLYDQQCQQLIEGSICAQTTIGKVCECDTMYYWNGFKCVSVNKDSVETTTSQDTLYYRLHKNYGYTKIVGLSFAGILGGYLFIVLGLHLYLKNKKKQVKRKESVHRLFHKKGFTPRLVINGKTVDNKEIIKEHKIQELKVVQ